MRAPPAWVVLAPADGCRWVGGAGSSWLRDGATQRVHARNTLIPGATETALGNGAQTVCSQETRGQVHPGSRGLTATGVFVHILGDRWWVGPGAPLFTLVKSTPFAGQVAEAFF